MKKKKWVKPYVMCCEMVENLMQTESVGHGRNIGGGGEDIFSSANGAKSNNNWVEDPLDNSLETYE